MNNLNNIKVLVVSISAWNDNSGNNTLQNIFKNFNPINIFSIYARSEIPETKFCKHFFQISEIALLKRFFNNKIIVGKELNSKTFNNSPQKIEKNISQENNLSKIFKKYRNNLFVILRELIWKYGYWRNSALDEFIDNSKADIIFVPISSCIYINRIVLYTIKRSGKKVVPFFVDDSYTYKAISPSIINYIHRYILRKKIKAIIQSSNDVLVISPKMKKEYDKLFNIKTHIFTKGIEFDNIINQPQKINLPIRMLYTGNLLYGRSETLAAIASAIAKINYNYTKAQLFIYTQTEISDALRKKLEYPNSSFLFKAVPYSELNRIQKESDILVFPESLNKSNRRTTRLSFSTKLTDYLSSGKCIFAVGPSDIASIEYLKENKCSAIVYNLKDIYFELNNLINNKELIHMYSENSLKCCKQFHDKSYMDKILYDVFRKDK